MLPSVLVSSDADSRTAFEEFYVTKYAPLFTNTPQNREQLVQRITQRDEHGCYAMPDVERCWQSWRAGETWLLRPR